MRNVRVVGIPVAFILAACGSESNASTAAPDASAFAMTDASSIDESVDAPADMNKSATCARHFGSALTDAFGRLDGTVVAVVPPNDQACAAPNATHLVVQVMMNGAVYRMVIDVLSNQGSPDVLFFEKDAPLVGEPWSEGWHTDIPFDYVTNLSVTAAQFTATPEADLVAKISSEISLQTHISFFATSQTEHDSAHLVHRQVTNGDGAIVIGPDTTSPHYLLMHFDEQDF